MREKYKIPCKIKKAEIFRQNSGAKMPRMSQTGFSSFGTRQSFYARRKSFQTLCLFNFCLEISPFAASSRPKGKTSKLNSVIQLSNNIKTKEAVTFQALSRTFALPLLKQF